MAENLGVTIAGGGRTRRLLNLAAVFDYPTAAFASGLGVDFEQLQSTYIRLFGNHLGGIKAPPYAGCYLSGQDRLQFMARFSGLCQRLGVALKPSEPPDYIPLMVEVMALLLGETAQGEEIDSLVAECYAGWPQGFADALGQHDDIGIYAEAALELRQLLDELN